MSVDPPEGAPATRSAAATTTGATAASTAVALDGVGVAPAAAAGPDKIDLRDPASAEPGVGTAPATGATPDTGTPLGKALAGQSMGAAYDQDRIAPQIETEPAAERCADLAKHRKRTRRTWIGVLAAPWLLTVVVVTVGPGWSGLSRTGLAITENEAIWLAAWVLAVACVTLSGLVRRNGGSPAARDEAERHHSRAAVACARTGSQAANMPASDPNAEPTVAVVLGAMQSSEVRRKWAIVAERRSGLRGLIVGHDGRVSTSKLQAAMWTLAVLYAFIFLMLAGWHIWDRPETPDLAQLRDGFAALISKPLQPEYLVLLGIPVASAVAAKAITQNKVVNGNVVKSVGTQSGIMSGISETISDDSGSTDLLDAQYAAFNLIMFIFFFAAFLGQTASNPTLGLPDLPPTLLGLSGVSAAAYVTKKGLEKGTAPQVIDVQPRLIRPGTELRYRITGNGFCVDGRPTSLNAVTIGGVAVSAVGWTDSETWMWPPTTADAAKVLGLVDGPQPLVVSDESGNQSEPFLVHVALPADPTPADQTPADPTPADVPSTAGSGAP